MSRYKDDLLAYADAFAKDLAELCPLSKLAGTSMSRAASRRLPSLPELPRESCDEDLQYVV